MTQINNLKSNDRLVFNTIAMYANSIVSIFVMLYVTRVIVEYLGPNDFGLNNVIAGVVSMLTFLSASMATSTQRYISHSLGSGDVDALKSVYSNSFVIHLILGIFLVVLFEIFGLYFVNFQLNIHPDRYFAANCLLQFTIVTTFFTIYASPNDALLNATESMGFLAILGIFEVVLKLIVAIGLKFIMGDRLIAYGFMLMCISIVLRTIKWYYVRKHYPTFKIERKYLNRTKMKELYHFAGWNLFGSLSVIGKNQGFAIAINLFFNTLVNAAFAISNQVSGQLLFFSRNLLKSMDPQIVKAEGGGDRAQMIKLSYQACKFGYVLTAFIAIPFIFEIDRVLELWLTQVPPYTSLFCKYMIISMLIGQITIGLQTAVYASGSVKMYQFLVGSVQLSNVPVYFYLFHIGSPPYYAIIAYCVSELVVCIVRFRIFQRITSATLLGFFIGVFSKQITPTVFSILACWLITLLVDFQFRFIVTFAVSISGFFLLAYHFSLNETEKTYFSTIINRVKNKIKF